MSLSPPDFSKIIFTFVKKHVNNYILKFQITRHRMDFFVNQKIVIHDIFDLVQLKCLVEQKNEFHIHYWMD